MTAPGPASGGENPVGAGGGVGASAGGGDSAGVESGTRRGVGGGGGSDGEGAAPGGAPGGPPRRPPRSRTVSLRVRILLAFLAAVVGTLGLVTWLVSQQVPLGDSLRLLSEGYLPLSRQVAVLQQDQGRVQRDLTRLARGRPRVPAGEASAAEVYTDQVRDNIAIARVIAEGMSARTTSPEERAALAKALSYLTTIEDLFQRYQQQSDTYLSRSSAGEDVAALEELRRPLRTTEKRLGEELDKLELTVAGRIRALTRDSEVLQARATTVAVSVAAGSLAVLFLLLWLVILALRPLGRLAEQATRVAAGDYGLRVEVAGDDEVGHLAAEFNAMAEAVELRDRSLQERAVQLDRLSRHLASVLDSLQDALLVVEGGVVTRANPAAVAGWSVAVDAPPPDALAGVVAPGVHELSGPPDRRFVARTAPFGAGGAVVVIADVTEEVHAQQQLARSERLAVIGQMLAQVTHEVRNPLNSLSLNLELLGDELLALDPDGNTEVGEVLALMTSEVDRLTAVTGHYLALARRPEPRPSTLRLGELLSEVARLVEPEQRAAGVTLRVTCAVDGLVVLDGNLLRQALLNVLGNAAQAGARTITVRAEVDDGALQITVQDDGEGMDPDSHHRAGEPFFTTKATGTGLGLAITRQILEDQGGHLTLRSTPGQGTEVVFRLPLVRPGDARVHEEEP